MKFLSYRAAALCIATMGCQPIPVATADSDYDIEKMAHIENAARAAGVTVIWINPPVRKKVEIAGT